MMLALELFFIGLLGLAVLAIGSLHRTRDLYLFLAGFHAYLEIALLGYLLVRRPA